MKVAATKTMARELNKAIQHTRFAGLMTFQGVNMRPDQYGLFVSNSLTDMETDYNSGSGLVRAISVIYSPESYAATNYITTRDLNRIFTTGENIYVYDGKNSIPAALNFSTVDIITLGNEYDLTVGITQNEICEHVQKFIDNYKGAKK